MKTTYYRKLINERETLEKMTIFQELVASIQKKMSLYSDYCTTEREDVRFYQGYVLACTDILGKGEGIKILDDIIKKSEEIKP